jgi:hypothetical protein
MTSTEFDISAFEAKLWSFKLFCEKIHYKTITFSESNLIHTSDTSTVYAFIYDNLELNITLHKDHSKGIEILYIGPDIEIHYKNDYIYIRTVKFCQGALVKIRENIGTIKYNSNLYYYSMFGRGRCTDMDDQSFMKIIYYYFPKYKINGNTKSMHIADILQSEYSAYIDAFIDTVMSLKPKSVFTKGAK